MSASGAVNRIVPGGAVAVEADCDKASILILDSPKSPMHALPAASINTFPFRSSANQPLGRCKSMTNLALTPFKSPCIMFLL